MTLTTLRALGIWECVAFDHEPGFLEMFCPGGEQLIDVAWHSEGMRFTYLGNHGGHVANTASMKEWLSFFDNHIANY